MWFSPSSPDFARYNALPNGLRYWLDYWLFLHSDDAFPFLKARPIGLHSLAHIATNLSARDRSLTKALGDELEDYRPFLKAIGVQSPASPPLDGSGGNQKIASEWLDFLSNFLDASRHFELIQSAGDALKQSSDPLDYLNMTFLTRRLASELSDHYWNSKWLHILARIHTLEECNWSVIDKLVEEMGSKEFKLYEVTFDFSRIEVDQKLSLETQLAKLRWEGGRAPVEGQAFRAWLIGLDVRIRARDANHAFERALKICRACVKELRLKFYVRTNVSGTVLVATDNEIRMFGLPHPFWTSRSPSVRGTPGFPGNFHSRHNYKNISEKEHWDAAREQVSAALNIWPESAHHAASSVWQALEALYGSSMNVFKSVPGDYGKLGVEQLVRDLRKKLESIRWNHKQSAEGCDWPSQMNRAVTDEKWIRRTLNPGSNGYYGRWKDPRPPAMYCGPRGLLQSFYAPSGAIKRCMWLESRVERDLRHLYALRNSLVHRGFKVGSDRWAGYLAALGLEVVFALAHSTHSQGEISNVQAKRAAASSGDAGAPGSCLELR